MTEAVDNETDMLIVMLATGFLAWTLGRRWVHGSVYRSLPPRQVNFEDGVALTACLICGPVTLLGIFLAAAIDGLAEGRGQ